MLDNELKLPAPGQTGRPGTHNRSMTASTTSLSSPGDSHKMKSGTHDRQDVLASLERIQNFEEAFNKIKSATGVTDIDELVRTFIKNEDHNFSLFNYVNEQNNEVEKVEEQIQALREEERKYATESGEDVQQHKQILKELENKLQASESMVEKYEVRAQDLQRAIESLKRGIQSIYEKLGLESEDGLGQPMITELNMVHYIGVIERKANEILQKYAEGARSALMAAPSKFDEKEDGKGSPSKSIVSVLGGGPKVGRGTEVLQVNPPKLEEYQSDEDADEEEDEAKPLTREELKTRTIAKLQRKGGGGGKAKATKRR
jgi:coiled-coil domain-containing protein 63/114